MSRNIPITIWRNTDGIGEYSSTGIEDIVDDMDTELVDIFSENIIDTGILFTDIPKTEWEEDDSK